MVRKTSHRRLNEALRLNDHGRPISRRDFLGQGLLTGLGLVTAPTLFGLFANPRSAAAALSPDLETLKSSCGIKSLGAGKIPFICFDLAGGANIAGSNVLVGKQGGQLDSLSTAGYSKLGLPGDMTPDSINPLTGTSFINMDYGLGFHASSAMLRGIQEKAPGRSAEINGAVIPARSDNDTANNPHNPVYGIARAGADGSLLTLIGSSSSDSGGNSMAPARLFDPSIRPTKVDRPSDVTGMVDTGQLIGVLSQEDAVAVMESIERISRMKLDQVDTRVTADAVIKDLVQCGYVKAADIADRFGDPTTLDPALDPDIVGPGGIFGLNEFNDDREFRKTASVMKMVINGFAGAGTITLGGYDYHTGDRATGELRDLRAGRCIGACLEYAARANNGSGVPLMIYVFSDGSVASNGTTDDTPDGGGKGVWTGDNSSTAASFFLIYNPGARPQLIGADMFEQALHQQLGHFRSDGSVETNATPAANQVNLLVETVILNYMALHGEQGNFSSLFPNHGLGNAALMDRLTAFNPIVAGTI
ncbi:MAG: general secretion pathway protein GspF [Gammaproteobacteria bacterium]|jgi:hypothetical protein|nr:general secretion pathway protein GspF [Gammaproteobacteria bacterium]